MSTPSRDETAAKRKRPNRRQIAAAATRAEILRAARSLFGARGFASTSMSDIAVEAGVSLPTIYESVGPKASVVLALYDMVDAEVGGARAADRISTARDPAELIAVAVKVNRLLSERAADIVGALRRAADTEPAVAAVVAASTRQHRAGSRAIAERLASLGALRHGVDVARAADVIALLADHDIVTRLVTDAGWSIDEAEAWLNATLRGALLADGASADFHGLPTAVRTGK